MMPELNGIEVCEQIRDTPSVDHTIVAMLSARSEAAQNTGFEAGADDYIVKPIRPKVLVSRLKALIIIK